VCVCVLAMHDACKFILQKNSAARVAQGEEGPKNAHGHWVKEEVAAVAVGVLDWQPTKGSTGGR
jgi:hypothetical protein